MSSYWRGNTSKEFINVSRKYEEEIIALIPSYKKQGYELVGKIGRKGFYGFLAKFKKIAKDNE